MTAINPAEVDPGLLQCDRGGVKGNQNENNPQNWVRRRKSRRISPRRPNGRPKVSKGVANGFYQTGPRSAVMPAADQGPGTRKGSDYVPKILDEAVKQIRRKGRASTSSACTSPARRAPCRRARGKGTSKPTGGARGRGAKSEAWRRSHPPK